MKVQELMANEVSDSFLSRGLEKSIDQSDLECCESTSSNEKNGSDSENSIRRINSVNTPYPVTQGTTNGNDVKSEHLYSASANEIDEKKHELKNFPQHLEYAYLHETNPFIINHPNFRAKEKISTSYKTFAYRRMLFGLCNAPATFQRCMTVFFHDMVEDFMEVFMDDFSVFEGIVLGHKISGAGIEVDRAKIDVIAKLPYPTNVKGVRSFLGHAGFYRRLENPDLGTFTEEEITDEFPDEHLMILKAEHNMMNHDILDEPYAFKLAPSIYERCVAGNEILKILGHCHSRPTGGHHSASITGRKVYESGFYWPSIFKDAKDYVMRCDACQRSRKISSRSEMPQNNIQEYGVTHKLSTPYHPQTNGQTEVTNRAIKRILERSVGYNPKNWSEKLNDAFWAFKTTYKTPTGCTLFRLVYGKACQLPMKIEHKAYWALKQCNMDLTAAAKNRFMELNELIELRDEAHENTRIYKERTKKWHDSRL
ncbi:reverse transcriptase domain-containing protein [Tanacetum coccineum]|uniref:Reverse transcriptase domain-containing protein n=1 Tax=Tanacetum coccineum TaxID=301880 RepID=A0ABQ5BJ57_9ASTR